MGAKGIYSFTKKNKTNIKIAINNWLKFITILNRLVAIFSIDALAVNVANCTPA
jgi:hypothetical protein